MSTENMATAIKRLLGIRYPIPSAAMALIAEGTTYLGNIECGRAWHRWLW